MKEKMINRWAVYIAGLVLLALGLVLNTKTGMGASPIVSIALCVSTLTGGSFANWTLAWYCVLVLAEMALHLLRRRGRLCLVMDLLQLPLSLVFTRFMGLFSGSIPDFSTECAGSFWGTLGGRTLVLAAAIVLTGVGAAMSLDMRLIPNPGDGVVQSIADFLGLSVGTTKNCVDICCVCVSLAAGLAVRGTVVGVGAGTLLAMVGVGRCIALFNRLALPRLRAAAGLEC